MRYEESSLTADGERVWMEYRRMVPGEDELLVAEVLELRGSFHLLDRGAPSSHAPIRRARPLGSEGRPGRASLP